MRKRLLPVVAVVALAFVGLVAYQALRVRNAHASFDSYYAFRGCTQLLQRGSDFGVCSTQSGQVIKIVQYGGKWYRDGDGPVCYFRWCF